MIARLAKLVLALAGIGLLGGIVGFLIASGPRDWADLAEGMVWYGGRLAEDQPLLLPLGLVALGVALGLLGVTLHRRARFRRTRSARHRARAAEVQLLDLNRDLGRATRRLDRELTRARRDPERALEALFTALTELEAQATGLQLERDRSGMVVEVNTLLRGRGEPQPIVSITESLLRRLLERLSEMLGQAGTPLRGDIEYRTASRSDLIRVETSEGDRGLRLLLRLAPDLTGPGRRRVTFMPRPDRTPIPERSGEVSQQFSVDDSTDRHSGLVLGLDPSGEREVAPVVERREPRPVDGLEAALRILAAFALLACVGLVAGRALEWGWRRARTGVPTAPWREVAIQIDSSPTGAEVSIDGELRGRTPLRVRKLCKGQPLLVLVGATGHRTWNWRGTCPAHGPLQLAARLQPLP